MSASRAAARVSLAIAAAMAAAVSLSGCAIFGPDALPSSTGSARSSFPRPDVTVRIGTLVAMTGAAAEAGASTRAAVQLAAEEVNAAGLGVRLEIIAADAGTPGDGQAVLGAQELIDAGVDAVVGPRSSAQSLEVYRMFADAGIVELSPVSTLPELSNIADDGYFYRTVPSDALQARILGNRILFDGATTVGIVRVDSEYSAALAAGLTETFDMAGAAVVADVTIESGLEAEAAEAVLASDPEAVVIITRSDTFGPIAEALGSQGIDWSTVYGTDTTVEVYRDRLDVPTIAGAVFSSAGVFADRDFVTALHSVDPAVRLYAYTPEAYDAVILIALAALSARSSNGGAIRDQLIPVSRGPGTVVETFADGAQLLLSGADIDYDGLSGPLDFLPNGDVGEGFISFYRYGADNALIWVDQSLGSL